MMDMQYVYAAGQNNGRITQSIDGVANETVNYTYDALNRLASANATNGIWGQGFTYDGFGNLTQKVVTQGAAPTLSVAFDPATNRQAGIPYDSNGNMAVYGSAYDGENRLLASYVGGYPWNYEYDPQGRRVLKTNASSGNQGEMYFYGIGGQKLATYQCATNGNWSCGSPAYSLYFGGKLIIAKGVAVATDRLGSVRANAGGDRMTYYPYGDEKTSTLDGREKFGTYMRDGFG